MDAASLKACPLAGDPSFNFYKSVELYELMMIFRNRKKLSFSEIGGQVNHGREITCFLSSSR
jgi:hypothetical protein